MEDSLKFGLVLSLISVVVTVMILTASFNPFGDYEESKVTFEGYMVAVPVSAPPILENMKNEKNMTCRMDVWLAKKDPSSNSLGSDDFINDAPITSQCFLEETGLGPYQIDESIFVTLSGDYQTMTVCRYSCKKKRPVKGNTSECGNCSQEEVFVPDKVTLDLS